MSGRHYLETLLGLLYPTKRFCISCHTAVPEINHDRTDEPSLCSDCKNGLLPIEPPYCQLCGRHLQESGRCPECERDTAFVLSRSYGAYRGVLRDLLHRFKFSREAELLSVLGPCLREAWDRHMAHFPIDLLVPVPVHPKRLQERGYNQAERLVHFLTSYTRTPWHPVLQRTLHMKGQVTRTRQERLQALLDAYSLHPDAKELIQDKTILLVDDIYTTGSTAEACAKVLKAAGAAQVYVLTVAR
jgi:ComF family protein